MANIKITVEGPLMNGHKITFKAPCNCDVVEKLDVRYIEDNTQKSKLFTMKDSHGNDLTGLGNLFYKDAYVDVVLDPNSRSAYLQNAGTNGYLEGKITPVDNLESDRADLPLSARQGKILNESLGGYALTTKDGKIAYYQVSEGADSAVPFKSGEFIIPNWRVAQYMGGENTYLTLNTEEYSTLHIESATHDNGYSQLYINDVEYDLPASNITVDVSELDTVTLRVYTKDRADATTLTNIRLLN